MKKSILRFSLVITMVFVLFLAACSNSNTNTNTNGDVQKNNSNNAEQEDQGAQVEQSDEQEEVTISLFSNHGQFQKGQFGYRQVEEFMKANPKITVEITTAIQKQWDDTFLALAASNDLPDVIQPTRTFGLAELLEREWIQPLDGLVSEDFRERFPEGTFVQGINMDQDKIYSFPRIATRIGYFQIYNTDMMEEVGLDPSSPPKTWDELFEMSQRAKEKDVYGLAMPLKIVEGYKQIISLAQSLQPTLDVSGFDYQKGHYDFDSPNLIKAFEFILKMRDSDLIHPNSPTLNILDYQGVVANKQAIFGFNRQHAVRVYEFELDGVEDYDITSMPVAEEGGKHYQPAATANVNAFISSTTEYPEAAGKLVDWISSKEYFSKQLQEDLLTIPLSDLLDDENNFSKPQLKHMADVFKETVIARPIPEKKSEALDVKKIETTISKPKPDWWEILQGAYFGEVDNWKEELTRINNEYNKRFEDAIKKAQDEGLDVSKDDFTFPEFDGTVDYKN